ncbi:hypothetical protein C7974DRAFT_381793 [Boeremia exigua]|uniref:uncharacterized protein n=1 Tax=Boeremia exigua TaxID=749465 RepID=UPI001E8E5C1F|nr:uncharacterized protein C7974DRAFT_381793 [Boeremia exigua]KAH6643573.1 hypothetical protein C7974DRAFT_381793 [Boeremia exigua]
MSSHSTSTLKQIACIRRKSDMTREEFFTYHFQIHGSISDKPTTPDHKPHKYIQTHFFDAAFGSRSGSTAGTGNHVWTGRDDMTELWFRDWDHLKACFGSDHVRKTIGPDGVNFNDLETAIPLMTIEKELHFGSAVTPSARLDEGFRTVAVLFLACKAEVSEEQFERELSPALLEVLQTYASDEVYGIQANISLPQSQFDIRAYFGGKNMPEYPVTYKIYIKDRGSLTAIRKAQRIFMDSGDKLVDASNSFIAFGKEGLVFDVGSDRKFDPNRQPMLSY